MVFYFDEDESRREELAKIEAVGVKVVEVKGNFSN